jgi:hypothetical protein
MSNHDIYKKLNAARAAFHEHKLTKTGYNSFSNFDYFELNDFLPHALTTFRENGLCGVVSFGADLATLAIIDVDTAQAITITSPMSTASLKACHPVQNLGAVLTYTRRYLWSAAMELIETDPLDASSGKEEQKAHQQANVQAALPIKPAPKKAAPKAAADDEEIWDVVLDSITPTEGMGKNGKPFKRWQLKWDGGQISTFDKTLGESLKEGQQVRLIVKADGKFHKLVGIEEAYEELVPKKEKWTIGIVNVVQEPKGRYWEVTVDDLEHPIIYTKDKALAVRAAQWIEDEPVDIQVQPGSKEGSWVLVDVPERPEGDALIDGGVTI